jgi:hypothetical protein
MKVELVNGGVWQSFEKIDVEIEKIRSNGSGSSKILAALYCQIKFHKEILQSKGPKELFQKTVKNKRYTELELIQNLKQILILNSVDKGTEKPKSLDLKPMQDIKTDIENIKNKDCLSTNESFTTVYDKP